MVATAPKTIAKLDSVRIAAIQKGTSINDFKLFVLHLINSYAFLLGNNSQLDGHRMEICVGHGLVEDLSDETHQWGTLKEHALHLNNRLFWYCCQNYEERRLATVLAARQLFDKLADLVAVAPSTEAEMM